MNYAELRATCEDWANDTDIASMFDTFLRLAEEDVNRHLSTMDMEARATATLTGQYFALPADFNGLRAAKVKIDGYWRQLVMSVSPASQETLVDCGDPRFISVLDGQFYLAPEAKEHLVEIVYAKKAPALTAASPTNWLLDEHVNAYLCGVIKYAYDHICDMDKEAYWSAKFNKVLNDIQAHDVRKRFRGPLPAARPHRAIGA